MPALQAEYTDGILTIIIKRNPVRPSPAYPMLWTASDSNEQYSLMPAEACNDALEAILLE